MKKRDKPRCSISHLGGNRYLLEGTPDQEVIENTVAEQEEPYIVINVNGGNIRDLSGSIISIPNAGRYLVFKRLFEVSKRPAVYLMRDIAQKLLTTVKENIEVSNDRVLMGGHEFVFAPESREYPSMTDIPVGYISTAIGKKILQPSLREETRAPVSTIYAPITTPSAFPVAATPIDSSHPVADANKAQPIEKPVDIPNNALSIIGSIASDERNLKLLKDIAYTAYAIISKVKGSGAASKEEIATCVMAALSDPDTRSRLRRIGNDIFRRFMELNKEAGSVVDITSGYRFTPDNEVVFDEYPDDDMLAAISAGMNSPVVKAYINYDRSLGYPNTFIHCAGADFGYIAKNAPLMFIPSQDGHVVGYFDGQPYDNAYVVNAGFRDGDFFALIMDRQKIFEVSSSNEPDMFGCYSIAGEPKLFLLCKSHDNVIAEHMAACSDVCTIKKQYAAYVIDALPAKVIRIIDPHSDDIKALISRGFKIGTEKKGDGWLLWAFPAGKTLNMPGLPKIIAGGVPQY